MYQIFVSCLERERQQYATRLQLAMEEVFRPPGPTAKLLAPESAFRPGLSLKDEIRHALSHAHGGVFIATPKSVSA